MTWEKGDWQHTLSTSRNAKTPASDRKSWRGPYWDFNLSSSVTLNRRSTLGVTVKNLFDSVREDRTGGWPNYNVGYYQPYGRQVWLELNHKFAK